MVENQQNKIQLLQFIKESFTYSFTKIIPGFLGFFSVIIFLRILGPEEYGLFSMLFLLVQISSFFCFGWLRQALLRYYGRLVNTPTLEGIIVSGLFIAIIVNVFILTLFKFFQFPLTFSLTPVVFLSLAMIFVSLADVLFMVQEKPKKVVQLTTVQSILAIFFPVLLIMNFYPSHMNIITGLGIAYGITAIVFISKQLYQRNPAVKLKLLSKKQFQHLRPLFQFGWPLSFWYAASTTLRFLDRYFIENFLGTATMGSYAGFIELITRFFTVLLFPVTLALHPRMMNFWNEKKYSSAYRLLWSGIIIQFFLFIVVLFIYIFFKSQWLILLFKLLPDLDPAMTNIIIPAMLGGFIWQFALLIHKPLEVQEKSKLMLLFICLSVCINIIGNYIFIPRIGVIASAYTMIVSGSVYSLFSMLASSRFWTVRVAK